MYLDDTELEATSLHIVKKLQAKGLAPDIAGTWMQSVGALRYRCGLQSQQHARQPAPSKRK